MKAPNVNLRGLPLLFHVLTIGGVFLCGLAYAQMEIKGPIDLKGQFDGKVFHSQSFDVTVDKEKFVITCDQRVEKFVIPATNAQKLYDVAVSHNNGAVVALIRSINFQDPQVVLTTVCDSGETRVFNYKNQHMTNHYEWIEELGAVSDGGDIILAKFGYFLLETGKS